jgi:lysophospholipase L1-like esterase
MIVFLGDCLFEQWDKQIYSDFFSEFSPINFGSTGYTSRDLLIFLELTGLHGLRPEVIILSIGTNNSDHSYTTTQTFNEISQIIDLLYEFTPESEIILLGILPRGLKPEDRKRILNEHINKKLQVAKFSKSVHYADIGYLFLDKHGLIPEGIMHDGLHLTKRGYFLLSEALSGFISAVLPGPSES